MSNTYNNYYYMMLQRWMTGHDVPEFWLTKFETRYEKSYYVDQGSRDGSRENQRKEAA